MTRFSIDPDATSVWSEVRSSLHPIHSETRGMQGYFEGEVGSDGLLDLSSEPAAHLELPVGNMSSGNPLYDREMMRRVDARHYPMIIGSLSSMEVTGTKGRYRTAGEITFRGVSRTVADEVTFSTLGDGTIVFEGSHVFDLHDFGMEPPKIMFLRVYPEVTIKVRIVAREGA